MPASSGFFDMIVCVETDGWRMHTAPPNRRFYRVIDYGSSVGT